MCFLVIRTTGGIVEQLRLEWNREFVGQLDKYVKGGSDE